MSFFKRGSQLKHLTFADNERRLSPHALPETLIFAIFVTLFYLFLISYIKPVSGINDDWGMYSMLSGAYLGYPDAHVLFFLYPLSWLLSRLYELNSAIPWYGIFQHAVHILCIGLIYRRTLQLWKKHTGSDFVLFPALSVLATLFFLVDLNVLSEVQYTTTAGFAVSTALFYFITTKSDDSFAVFLKGNIPTLILAWLAFCIRQNVLYMMLPAAGMIWLAKWLLSNQRFYKDYLFKLFSLAAILALGMGILYGLHNIAYSSGEWKDFAKINYYRERVTDFYTWPAYEECADELEALSIDEEAYYYMRNGAPYIGYHMSAQDWKQMHRIAKDCYYERTSLQDRLKDIVSGSLNAFLYRDGMQPFHLCVAAFFLITLLLIFGRRNAVALGVYLFYLTGRMVTWGYLLSCGRFPKRIIQPLIAADFMVLLGILFAFNLFITSNKKALLGMLICVTLLSIVSVYNTKKDVDASYHIHQAVWEDLKAYCRNRPDNFYIWTYGSDTIENYCESPFASSDDYQNFFYTNWGVVCNPNSLTKLKKHGIGNFAEDLAANPNVYFIFREGTYHRENPTIMYFRHTYHVDCELADTFAAGENTYEVYQLR